LPDYLDFICRFITFAVFHSVLASTLLKKRIHIKAGSQYRYYRLLYNLLSLIIFGWVMLAYRHSPVIYFVPGIWSLFMYLLQLILVVAMFKCLQQTNISDFLGFRQLKHQETKLKLVTNGFYGVVRHPLYLLSILFFVFNPVMTAQWMFLTICSSIYFIIGAHIEEKRFLDDFGDEYCHYKQIVPFIFPNLMGSIGRSK
jgi:protein-S-isoprenylcysteine O-methyltransferase Ste14